VSTDIGAVAEFANGTIRTVGVNGREIGVVQWNGAMFAVHNLCTHQSGPVCAGILSGRLTAAQPGGMELDATMPILACPWHGWEFDLRTGRALRDAQHRLRTFPIRVENGRVLVEIGGTSDDAIAARSQAQHD
jgi:nitrite reductase/ring-hydroxylating ferredoxin subunit